MDSSKYAARAAANRRAAPVMVRRPSPSQSASISSSGSRTGQRLMISWGITTASRLRAQTGCIFTCPGSVREKRNHQPGIAAEQDGAHH